MGTNSEKIAGYMDKQFGLIQDIAGDITQNQSNPADDQAKMMETEARSNAWNVQQGAKKDAGELRAKREMGRAHSTAGWGGSNLAMSGSKKLIRNSQRLKDRQAEEDVLFQGQADADAILADGRQKGNMLRINSGSSPNRSTLSMGSKIYGGGK